jgi:hypothetical protein
VVAGIVFLLLAIAGQLAGRIVVAPERQRWAALIGGGLLVIGVALHIVPQLRVTPPTGRSPTPQPSTPTVKEPLPQPPAEPPHPLPTVPIPEGVEAYRIRTDYLFTNSVEFSVFVNDVWVGSYNSDVTADISRFIKPGPNQVRMTWTSDPNMHESGHADLFLDVKLGKTWNPVVSRRIRKTTKPGEFAGNVQGGTASQ